MMYSDDIDLPKNISKRKKDSLTTTFIPSAAHSFIGKSTETLIDVTEHPERKQIIFQTEGRRRDQISGEIDYAALMTQNEKPVTPRRIIVKRKQVKIEPNEIESDNPLDTTIEHSYDESQIISDMHECSHYENKRTGTHKQI